MNYIPPACVGARIGSVRFCVASARLCVGPTKLCIGSARLRIGSGIVFRYQHVSNQVMQNRHVGLDPNVSGFVLQWNIGFTVTKLKSAIIRGNKG